MQKMQLFDRSLALISILFLCFMIYTCKQNMTILDPVIVNHFKIIYNADNNIYIMNGNGMDKNNLTYELEGVHWFSHISSDGYYILFTNFIPDTINLNHKYTTYIMEIDGRYKKSLNNTALRPFNPRFSPDGTFITFDATENIDDIFLINRDGTNLKNLTNDGDRDWMPQFSPDGSRILYISAKESGTDLYSINLDGSNKVNLTYDGNLSTAYCSISPDGSKIAYTSLKGGHSNIYLLNIDGTQKIQLTYSFGNSGAVFSYDNERIAYISRSISGYNINVIDSSGKNDRTVFFTERPSRNDYWRPNVLFTPDKEHLLFTGFNDDNTEIYIADLNSYKIKNLTNNPGNDNLAYVLPTR
jgi:Tol biopolymer transport system component